MDSLYIIIPAYNEQENIENTINSWYPIVSRSDLDSSSRLVIINDGSKDDTAQRIEKALQDKERIVFLNKKNSGHGPTLVYGYNYAVRHNADYIFQTDSDGQTNPEEFEQFWNDRGKNKAVIGVRKHRGDGIFRVIVERILCFILFLVYGVKINDSNAPFRLLGREFLEYCLEILPPNYNIPNVIITVIAVLTGNAKFVDISFGSRKGGKNSINFRRIAKIGINSTIGFFGVKKRIYDVLKTKRKYILSYNCYSIFAMIYTLVLSFIVSIQANITCWQLNEPNVDSAVFRYAGNAILDGQVPYLDFFDHKGPLIYLINAFGLYISKWRGIWLLEFVAIFISFLFIYKTAMLFSDSIVAGFSLTVLAGCLLQYFQGGNLTEEYALPFISIGTYIFLDYFIHDKTSIIKLLICGGCFASVCFLKLNMVVLWVIMPMGIIVDLLFFKRYGGGID